METVLALIVWVGLFIIGPPALLFWLIRRRRRREREARAALAAADSAAPVAAPQIPVSGLVPTPDASVEADAASTSTQTAPSGDYYRFPYGVPLVVYPILAIVMPAIQRTWLMVLFEGLLISLAVMFAREAFSRTSFEQSHACDPTLTRTTWRVNWLLFFAIPPAVLALFGAAHLWALWPGR